jgi:cell division initiation protein
MSGEKKFGTSAFGFSKSDVNAYIERLLSEFDVRLKEKDDEISNLKLQIREMKLRYESDAHDVESVAKEKERIASVLITAQETANSIIEEARGRADEERIQLGHTLEREREKIIDIKRDIKSIKIQITEMLEKYQGSLNESEEFIETMEEEYNVVEIDSEESYSGVG